MTSVRAMRAADWEAVARIYGEGIDDGEATFEVEAPTWDSFDGSRLPELRLVAEEGRAILAAANHPLVTLAAGMDEGADKAAELAAA